MPEIGPHGNRSLTTYVNYKHRVCSVDLPWIDMWCCLVVFCCGCFWWIHVICLIQGFCFGTGQSNDCSGPFQQSKEVWSGSTSFLWGKTLMSGWVPSHRAIGQCGKCYRKCYTTTTHNLYNGLCRLMGHWSDYWGPRTGPPVSWTIQYSRTKGAYRQGNSLPVPYHSFRGTLTDITWITKPVY